MLMSRLLVSPSCQRKWYLRLPSIVLSDDILTLQNRNILIIMVSDIRNANGLWRFKVDRGIIENENTYMSPMKFRTYAGTATTICRNYHTVCLERTHYCEWNIYIYINKLRMPMRKVCYAERSKFVLRFGIIHQAHGTVWFQRFYHVDVNILGSQNWTKQSQTTMTYSYERKRFCWFNLHWKFPP